MRFRSEDLDTWTSTGVAAHMGSICVLMGMQTHPVGLGKLPDVCRFQFGLKTKDGTLADEVNKNILGAERAWARLQSWTLPVLLCENNGFL